MFCCPPPACNRASAVSTGSPWFGAMLPRDLPGRAAPRAVPGARDRRRHPNPGRFCAFPGVVYQLDPADGRTRVMAWRRVPDLGACRQALVHGETGHPDLRGGLVMAKGAGARFARARLTLGL